MLTSNPNNPRVTVQVLRTIWFDGAWRHPGDTIEWDYIQARGLESQGKGRIVDRPAVAAETIIEPAAPAAPKGKAK